MVHEVPLYSSVQDTTSFPASKPPKASPSFCVPAPAKPILEVIKAPPADHAEGITFMYENSTFPVSAVTAKLPIILASPVYGKASTPVNPLPSPTNAVEVVVPETFKPLRTTNSCPILIN